VLDPPQKRFPCRRKLLSELREVALDELGHGSDAPGAPFVVFLEHAGKRIPVVPCSGQSTRANQKTRARSDWKAIERQTIVRMEAEVTAALREAYGLKLGPTGTAVRIEKETRDVIATAEAAPAAGAPADAAAPDPPGSEKE
jgi:hypothetical protein